MLSRTDQIHVIRLREMLQRAACILVGYEKKYRCVRPGRRREAVWIPMPRYKGRWHSGRSLARPSAHAIPKSFRENR